MPLCALIVDDDQHIRDGLREYLEEEGYAVLTARHGKAALHLLRRGPRPDVIVLDLLMPVMDGWDFRTEQLQDPELSNIPVVVITASGFSARTMKDQLHVAEFLSKPFAPESLSEALRRVAG